MLELLCYLLSTGTSTHKLLELLQMFCKARLVLGLTERRLGQLHQLVHTGCSSRIRHDEVEKLIVPNTFLQSSVSGTFERVCI